MGPGPGGIVSAGALALRAYRACKAAAGDFAEVTREISGVSIVIQELEEHAASPGLEQRERGSWDQVKLRSLIDNIIYPLREVEDLAIKYSSLSAAKKNNWDRLRFASKSIDDIRSRLILHTSLAQNYLDGLTTRRITRIENESERANAALTRVEEVLADIVKEVKNGTKQPSIISDEKWNVWTELKRELRLEGFPVEVVQQYRHQVKDYLYGLLTDAQLCGEAFADDELGFANLETDDMESKCVFTALLQDRDDGWPLDLETLSDNLPLDRYHESMENGRSDRERHGYIRGLLTFARSYKGWMLYLTWIYAASPCLALGFREDEIDLSPWNFALCMMCYLWSITWFFYMVLGR